MSCECDHRPRYKPRIRVLRNFPGVRSTGMTLLAACPPVADILSPQNIQSGQLISLSPVTGNWQLGCPEGEVPYWAQSDQADYDVIALRREDTAPGGSLVGLSALGDFVIETFWCDPAITWNMDDAVVAWHLQPGYVTKRGQAGGGIRIMGHVVPSRMAIDMDAAYLPRSTGIPPLLNPRTDWRVPLAPGAGNVAANSTTQTGQHPSVRFLTRWR